MNGRRLGVWSLEFDSFSAIVHYGFCPSLAVVLVPPTGVAWRDHDVHYYPRPNKSAYSIVFES